MPLIFENAAPESSDDLTLRRRRSHERIMSDESTPKRPAWNGDDNLLSVDAPLEQEWVGLMMEELNTRG